MTGTYTTEIFLKTEEETTRLSEILAAKVSLGDTLLLSGPIGAGKTHFARGLIQFRMRRVGVLDDVPSPTFTLVQTYDLPSGEIWHADLYRLTSLDEIVELGLDDAFEDAVVLIEWPDRLGSHLPENALHLTFSVFGAGRRVSIVTNDAKWREAFETAGM